MSNPTNDLTIIIILYQEKIELIRSCLDNIKNFKIIIIDNDNNLEIKKKISSEYKISKYILNKKNVGITKAFNMAINLSDTNYVLNINADCMIEKDSIIELLLTNQKYKDCFISSPRFYEKNNKLAHNSAVFLEKKITPQWNEQSYDGDVCVDWVLLAAILIDKKIMQEIGMLDENLFLYFPDQDICKRASLKKKSIIQVSKAKAIHAHGISKVNNMFKRIFIRNYNFTFDELYYLHKIKIHQNAFNSLRKKIKNYYIKFFLNFLLFRLDKATFYIAKILAFKKFKKFLNKKNSL